MHRRLRNLRFWILVFAVGWLTMVVIAIASWPHPGEDTPEELAAEVTSALRANDFHKLQPLLAVGGEDVARSTVEHFSTARVDDGFYRDGTIVVQFSRDGTRSEFKAPVEERDGRYVVNLVVTPTG
ncbi:hypothetical protein [Nocardia sp. NRRL S-836]|uniref:hypothetical protein n=1 Tax=Nocardia sp. NRRL S-836 TaxID=1519492 RepID=UPI0006AE0D83|nr:hypothetical protein [Nocardia sp. NRRL S-836]KOV76951.1 hypothetical protein ADL03_42830 [Nocardia sp. NRRL S-836]